MTPASRKTAAGYLRVSQARDGMLADRLYRDEIEAYAKAYGYRLSKVFADLDFSGRRGSKPRPAFQDMLDRCREFDLIIIPKLSRFGRSMRENLAAYDVLEEAGVGLVFLDLRVDTTTSGGKLMRNMLTAMAEYESDRLSESWRETHQYLARNGIHGGGRGVPFGYRYDAKKKKLIPVPDQARIVRELFERFAGGWGLRALAYDLNERGIVGLRGSREWNNTRIARLLDNATYAGWRHYTGQLTAGKWKPLISQELWEDVQALRGATKRDRPENRKGTGTSLLSSLMFCSCGAPMWRSSTSDPKRSTYECSEAAKKRRGTCRAGGISALRVEEFVTRQFLDLVSRPYARHVHRVPAKSMGISRSPRTTDYDRRLAEIDQRLDKLVNMTLASPSGDATDAAFKRAAEALEDEREAVLRERAEQPATDRMKQRRAAEIEAMREQLGDLPKIWEAATEAERNELLRVAVDKVEVLPGKTRLKDIGIRCADWLM